MVAADFTAREQYALITSKAWQESSPCPFSLAAGIRIQVD